MGNQYVTTPARERFFAKTIPEPNSGCLIWLGALQPNGYGKFCLDTSLRLRPRYEMAHRAAWILEYGEIPKGMCVLHTCDFPACVNFRHLKLGTYVDNSMDMARKGRGKKSRKGLPFGAKLVRANLTRPYSARVTVAKKTYYLGCYTTAEEAGAVAQEFRSKLIAEHDGDPS